MKDETAALIGAYAGTIARSAVTGLYRGLALVGAYELTKKFIRVRRLKKK